MSAITGIFYRNGIDVNPKLAKIINNKLSHRGPDGSAVWSEGCAASGHQMLWTTQESLHEILPFEKDGLVITADARIDNRKELSQELGIEDNEHVSDSYYILKAYQKWDVKCPDKLLGDFAFAIWDKKLEKFFCARDHMGVKPFYYYLNDDLFVFGTEIKSILGVPEVPNKLNEKMLAFFFMGNADNELTFYEDIKCLPAAHYLSVQKQKTLKVTYWELDPDLNIIMDSEKDYAEAFLEIFIEAIRCRLRSNFPIGFELSGGLDSSSIVCIVKEFLLDDLNNIEVINTFSNVYVETPESDESYYIQKVLDNDKIRPIFLNGDNISPLTNINQILWHQDQPFISPHQANQIRNYEKMQENKIRVLFSGEGGDEIVSHGGNLIRELFSNLEFKKFITEINGESENFNKNIYITFLQDVIFPSIPLFIKKIWIKFILNKNNEQILDDKFLNNLGIEKTDQSLILNQLNKAPTKEYHYNTVTSGISQTIFGIIDRATASFNIEERYPFFDKRVVEFCYSIPTEMKLKKGWERYILRIAMENILPPEIQWRQQKSDLSPVFKRNLMLFEKNQLEEIIYKDNNLIKDYLNIDMIQDILKKYESNEKQNLISVWKVILIDKWLKCIQ